MRQKLEAFYLVDSEAESEYPISLRKRSKFFSLPSGFLKGLYTIIRAHIEGKPVSRVLVDNGAPLNILLLRIVRRLPKSEPLPRAYKQREDMERDGLPRKAVVCLCWSFGLRPCLNSKYNPEKITPIEIPSRSQITIRQWNLPLV